MLLKRIKEELNQALKNKDALRVSTLRFLIAEINNYQISQKRKDLKDVDILSVISRQAKNRTQAIEEFKKGNREDLVAKETSELKILKEYLPEQLSREKISSLVAEAIKEVGAAGRGDMGKVMKAVMEKAKGRAEGKVISQIVAGELAKLQTKKE